MNYFIVLGGHVFWTFVFLSDTDVVIGYQSFLGIVIDRGGRAWLALASLARAILFYRK